MPNNGKRIKEENMSAFESGYGLLSHGDPNMNRESREAAVSFPWSAIGIIIILSIMSKSMFFSENLTLSLACPVILGILFSILIFELSPCRKSKFIGFFGSAIGIQSGLLYNLFIEHATNYSVYNSRFWYSLPMIVGLVIALSIQFAALARITILLDPKKKINIDKKNISSFYKPR